MNINPPHFSFPFTKPESNEAVCEYHPSDSHSISPRKIGLFKEMPVSKRIRINIVIADMKGLHPSQAVTENCYSVLVIRWEYTNKAKECLKANTDLHVGCSRGFCHICFLHFKVAGIVPAHPEGDHGLGGVAG